MATIRIRPSGKAGIGKIGRDFRAYILGKPEFTYSEIDKDSWLDPIARDYYLDRKVFYFSPTDQQGIPLVVRGPGEAPFYRPTRVASFGLANWNRYRQQGSEDCRSAFMKCAEWFMKFEEGRFVYRYDMLDLKAPWMAGIAQGQGISLLTRAYLLTRNPGFLVQAQKALLPLSTPLDEGQPPPRWVCVHRGVSSKKCNTHPEWFFSRSVRYFRPASNQPVFSNEHVIELMLGYALREYREMGYRWLVNI